MKKSQPSLSPLMPNLKPALRLVFLLTLLLGMTACGEDTPGGDGPEPGPVEPQSQWYIRVSHPWVSYHQPMNIKADGTFEGFRSADLKVETNMSEWGIEPDTAQWYSTQKGENIVYVYFTPNDTSLERSAGIVVYGIEGDIRCTDTMRLVQEAGDARVMLDSIAFDVPNSTMVLPQSAAASISGFDEANGNYYFADGTLPSVFSGDKSYILSPNVTQATPNGICGQYYLTKDAEGRDCMHVIPVPLENVISHLDISDKVVDLGSHVVEIRDAGGKALKYVTTKASGSDHIDISIPKTTFHNIDQTLLVTAAVGMSLSMKMNLQIGDGSLDYFSVIIDPDVTLDLEMDASVSQSFVDESYPFFTVLCGAFAVGPVVITPLIEFSLVIGAEGKVGMKAGIRYENNSGIIFTYQRGQGSDYALRENTAGNQKNKTDLSGSVYIEGSISCGLDESIGLGVYGTILYATAGIQERVKCTANISADIDKLVKDPDFLYSTGLLFSTDVTLQGVAALKSLGASLSDVKTLEKPYRLDSMFLFPKMEVIEADVSGRQAHLEMEVANDLLLPLGVGIDMYCVEPGDRLYDKGVSAAWEIDDSYFVGSYTLGEQYRVDPVKSRIGRDGSTPVNVFGTTVSLGTPSGLYIVRPFVSYNNTRLEDKSYNGTAVFYAESGCEEVFRKVLLDIAQSIDVADRPAGWCSDAPIVSWKGVSIDYDSDKTPVMSVDLSGSNAKGVVRVGSHTDGSKCLWKLYNTVSYDSPSAPIDGLDISDPNFDGFDWIIHRQLETLRLNVNRNCEALAVLLNAKPQTEVSSDVMDKLKSLELYGANPWFSAFRTSPSDRLNYRAPSFPALEKFSCLGESSLSSLTLTEVPTLREVVVEKAGQITEFVFKGEEELFELYDVDQYHNLQTLKVTNETADAVYTISDLKKLTRLDITGKRQRKVSVERCFPQDFELAVYPEGTTFSNANWLNGTSVLEIKECNLKKLWVNVAIDTVIVTDCQRIVNVDIETYSGKVSDLRLVNLPLLEKFYARDCGLKSFELSNLPSLFSFDISENHSLPRQPVPALFDEVRMRRYNAGESHYYDLGYDTAYDYISKSEYTDVDWGFYYPDEPDCGYHWSPERLGLSNPDHLTWP